MKKIGNVFARVISGLFGIMFLLSSLGGLINCFLDQSNLALYIIFTLIFFVIGITLLKIAVKRQPEKHSCEQNTVAEKVIPSFSSQYIEDGNTFVHTGRSPITDEEIPDLIQLGYENALLAEKTSNNPKFHRTECEEDLSYNFEAKYGNQVCALTDKFEVLYRNAIQTDELNQKIDLLQNAIDSFEKAKKFCYAKGKGGTIYFQDMYECLHNSSNSCFSYADLIQNNLDAAIQERDVIIPGILQIVNDNDCILQKNIYTKLPSVSKTDIQRILRKLEAEYKII